MGALSLSGRVVLRPIPTLTAPYPQKGAISGELLAPSVNPNYQDRSRPLQPARGLTRSSGHGRQAMAV